MYSHRQIMTMTQDIFVTDHLPTFTPVLNKDSKAYLWYSSLSSPKCILAPMVNQSELAFRLLCYRYGTQLAYTPMFHSKLFVQFDSYRKEQFETCLGDYPIIAQFCCNNAETMIEAVQLCQEKEKSDWNLNYVQGKRNYGYIGASGAVRRFRNKMSTYSWSKGDIDERDSSIVVNQGATPAHAESTLNTSIHPEDIKQRMKEEEDLEEIDDPYLYEFKSNIVAVDLNLGCPQRIAKVGYYGSFLMDDQKLIENILTTLTTSDKINVPVTAKIRIFPDVQQTLAYADMVYRTGISILCVHGRIRDQKGEKTGLADWEIIRMIRERIPDIPVIANGNIRCMDDVEECIRVTGVDAVMSANGALDNPAIFQTKTWVDPKSQLFIRDPNHPNVFIPRRELYLAKEYLNIVETVQPTIRHPTIRAHLFKMCNTELNVNVDLRSILASRTMNLEDFKIIVDELIHRSRYNLHTYEEVDHYFDDPTWQLDRSMLSDLPTSKNEYRAMYKREKADDEEGRLINYHSKPILEAKQEFVNPKVEENPKRHTQAYYDNMRGSVKHLLRTHHYRSKKHKVKENKNLDANDSVDELCSIFD